MKFDEEESKRVGIPVMRVSKSKDTEKNIKPEKKQKKNDFEKNDEEKISFRDED